MVEQVHPLAELKSRFRARLTPDLARMAKRSDAVRRQFVPSADELGSDGLIPDPFEAGKNYRGVYGLERVYKDRIVLTPHFDCSAFCRYCFKKTRTLAGEGRKMRRRDMDAALDIIRLDSDLRIALVTGGDPLRDEARLFYLLDGLAAIPHVQEIRIGTRNILFEPGRVTSDFASRIASYRHVDCQRLERSRSVAFGLSINHRDELSPAVALAVRQLVDHGLPVKGQVTLLRGVNDNVEALYDLYRAFGALGIQPYYLFHCMPVIGAGHFRTSVAKGQQLLERLSPLSGVLAPTYVYITQIGKHRVGLDSPLESARIGDARYIRRKSPYRAEDFFRFTGRNALPPRHEVDGDGFIISHYLDGDDG